MGGDDSVVESDGQCSGLGASGACEGGDNDADVHAAIKCNGSAGSRGKDERQGAGIKDNGRCSTFQV